MTISHNHQSTRFGNQSLLKASIGFGIAVLALLILLVVLKSGARYVGDAITIVLIASGIVAPVFHVWGIALGAKGIAKAYDNHGFSVTGIVLNLFLLGANGIVAYAASILFRIGGSCLNC